MICDIVVSENIIFIDNGLAIVLESFDISYEKVAERSRFAKVLLGNNIRYCYSVGNNNCIMTKEIYEFYTQHSGFILKTQTNETKTEI